MGEKMTEQGQPSGDQVKNRARSAETTGEHVSGMEGEGFVLKESAGAGKTERSTAALPPVDFSGFLLGLGQMVLIHLGEIPEPVSGKAQKDLAQASHTIDLLDLLAEKTRGNLTSDEAQLLGNLRRELKLKYVQSR